MTLLWSQFFAYKLEKYQQVPLVVSSIVDLNETNSKYQNDNSAVTCLQAKLPFILLDLFASGEPFQFCILNTLLQTTELPLVQTLKSLVSMETLMYHNFQELCYNN